jgi:non-specific serine/threonine protein kinase
LGERYSQDQNIESDLRLSLEKFYTVAGRAIGFALEQPLHVVALACSVSGILKQLQYTIIFIPAFGINGLKYFQRIHYFLMSVSTVAYLPIRILPSGHPFFGEGVDDYVAEILLLATGKLTAALPADYDFLRQFAKQYLTKLCHLPVLANPEAVVHELPPVEPPTIWDNTMFLANAPPMEGAEYLTGEVLTEWWNALDKYVHEQISKYPNGAVDWIQKQNPLWRTVGRVTFHLAENKRDEQRPFAFMATYTNKVAANTNPVQLPLHKALTQYAAARDRDTLLRLLKPINNAGEKCGWVKEMIDEQTVYQPRAWTPKQAYQLLQDIPALEEAGLIVQVPNWWKGKQASKPQVKISVGTKDKHNTLTAGSLLQFNIQTAINGEPLTEDELRELLNSNESFVRLRGEWVEVDKEKLQAALEHWGQVAKHVHEDGLTFYEGMRMLSGLPLESKRNKAGTEIAFREWSEVVPVGQLAETLNQIRNPESSQWNEKDLANKLNATLRPYQEIGVQWLRLMTQLGLGACLADDMGLGKTIQVIALLLIHQHQQYQHQQQSQQQSQQTSQPTSLLVAPASLLGNWESEIKKFAPTLTTRIVHSSGAGTDKPKTLENNNLVMTTYGMVERLEWLKKERWQLVILDEAQAIKNAGTKQSKAVKALLSQSRIALSGTPIENRLSDLWSLFDFLNPGLLGTHTAFAKFIKGLGKNNDQIIFAPLRKLTQPYILRRLKTDKKIIADLPEKTEINAYCGLTKRQAALYQQSVESMRKELEQNVDGIKRRGLILSYLMRFKQICNHPAQWLGDANYEPADSGKFERLKEIGEEIAAKQEKVLIFTQYREITVPLMLYLETIFQRSGLILDGSTPVKKRKEMVDAFQKETGAPFFVLSLKAGGTGLNLTAASHVIHFDRWWNPAVENQATDRAFRIGQRKNVLVHKFVCRGTVEEKIDELIAGKKSLAENVVEGGAETLVTEMNNEQLLDMVSLDLNKAAG